jgi:hypothetical protein
MMLAPANSSPTTVPTTHTILLMIKAVCIYEPLLQRILQLDE